MSQEVLTVKYISAKHSIEENVTNAILEHFNVFSEVATKWKQDVYSINVTEDSQIDLMLKAKDGRLFLKEKLKALENLRKELKEDSLRQGQVIDYIARTIKGMIEPLEAHLSQQENFTKIRIDKQIAEEAERRRKEQEAISLKAAEEKRLQEQEAAKQAAIIAEQQRLEFEEIKKKNAALEQEAKAMRDRIAKEDAAAKKLIYDAQQKEAALNSASDKDKMIQYLQDLKAAVAAVKQPVVKDNAARVLSATQGLFDKIYAYIEANI